MKVLIIEKERELLYALERLLKSKGYEVIPTFDGVQGYESVINESPDVVVIGVEIPRISAEEIAVRARKNGDIALILVCRDKEELTLKENGKILFDGLLALPFTPSELFDCINKAVRTK